MTLPIKPPYPPMEALLVSEIPTGENWEYEPKWDGFKKPKQCRYDQLAN